MNDRVMTDVWMTKVKGVWLFHDCLDGNEARGDREFICQPTGDRGPNQRKVQQHNKGNIIPHPNNGANESRHESRQRPNESGRRVRTMTTMTPSENRDTEGARHFSTRELQTSRSESIG